MRPYYEEPGITIFCGDCREILPGLPKADLVLTDPPYGDAHDTDYTRFSGNVARQSIHKRIEGDETEFDPSPWLALGSERILFGANRYSNSLPTGSWLIWDKRSPGGSKNVMSDAEVAWWSHGRGVYILSHTWDGFNRASERHTNYHPTQKPIALLLWCIGKARAQGTILDPYMGSGTTLVAAKRLGRRAIGIEIEEKYCEIAARRLQEASMPLLDAMEPTQQGLEGLL